MSFRYEIEGKYIRSAFKDFKKQIEYERNVLGHKINGRTENMLLDPRKYEDHLRAILYSSPDIDKNHITPQDLKKANIILNNRSYEGGSVTEATRLYRKLKAKEEEIVNAINEIGSPQKKAEAIESLNKIYQKFPILRQNYSEEDIAEMHKFGGGLIDYFSREKGSSGGMFGMIATEFDAIIAAYVGTVELFDFGS